MSRLTEWVDSLEEHEGPMTERERHLCTTLLYGLKATGHLVGGEDR
ncbi:hypothetical protein [Jiangella muralis]|nr:hypothetical protein [Jiangella muralis]